VLAVIILVSVIEGFAGSSRKAVELAGAIAVATALLAPSNALIRLGVQTVEEISEYGKLFLPVMTASLSAEGGTITSAALYTGTVLFNSILTTGITKILIPILYAYIALSITGAAIGQHIIKDLQAFLKWLITWTLKISIYIFTGYLGITGVVSGTADAAAVKAAKIAISGAVPVIGSIISDASETILASAGIMKNTVGTYGVLVIFAICIMPFLQIGVQYLLLKAVGMIGGILGCKRTTSLVESFSVAMGYLVAMIGAVCLLLLISAVCFMKGVH
jgi:stage III sporulation protein AE